MYPHRTPYWPIRVQISTKKGKILVAGLSAMLDSALCWRSYDRELNCDSATLRQYPTPGETFQFSAIYIDSIIPHTNNYDTENDKSNHKRSLTIYAVQYSFILQLQNGILQAMLLEILIDVVILSDHSWWAVLKCHMD